MAKHNQSDRLKNDNLLSPTAMEIELFAKDLLEGIEEIVETTGKFQARKFEKAKPQFNNLVNNLVNKWKNIFPLESVDHQVKGTNLVFKGSTAPYLVPTMFWVGRNPVKISVKSFKNWIAEFPLSISWHQFQIQLSDMLYDEQTVHAGLTQRNLEILRFYARFNLEFPYVVHTTDHQQRRKIFELFHLLYDKSLTLKQLNKKYNFIRDQYAQWDVIPHPKLWGLDCVLIHTALPNLDMNKTIHSLPIWVFQGKEINGEEVKFSLHLVNARSINKNDVLYNGLVAKMHFFWNFHHYEFGTKPKIKDRSRLILKSPVELYKIFEQQKFTLKDSLYSQEAMRISAEHISTIYQYLFAPEWELQIFFPFAKDFVDSDGFVAIKKREILVDIIKNYNLRHVDTNYNFFNQFQNKSQGTVHRQYFRQRSYFYHLPPSIRACFWIPFSAPNDKELAIRLIHFLKAWLHRGPIIEYNTGILIITYLPNKQLTSNVVTEIKNFFASFKTKIYIYLNNSINFMSTFSIYSLPESSSFNESSLTWNLPRRNIFPSLEEKINVINTIIKNEQLKN